MHRHHHLFERIGTLENLLAASREALKNGKRAKPPGALCSAKGAQVESPGSADWGFERAIR
mgnify:CR=1 FL=1